MALYMTTDLDPRQREWHVGEKFPGLPIGRVVSIVADGDELLHLERLLRSGVKEVTLKI